MVVSVDGEVSASAGGGEDLVQGIPPPSSASAEPCLLEKFITMKFREHSIITGLRIAEVERYVFVSVIWATSHHNQSDLCYFLKGNAISESRCCNLFPDTHQWRHTRTHTHTCNTHKHTHTHTQTCTQAREVHTHINAGVGPSPQPGVSVCAPVSPYRACQKKCFGSLSFK